MTNLDMMRQFETWDQLIEAYENGNKSDLKKWAESASKEGVVAFLSYAGESHKRLVPKLIQSMHSRFLVMS
jgi:hypothetical protein